LRQVVVASRRTDLLAGHTAFLKQALEQGSVLVAGPAGGAPRRVSLLPEDVHSLVLLTKNAEPILSDGSLRRLLERYDQVVVQLTVTGLGGTALEPGVPPMQRVLEQLGALVQWLGEPRRLTVRFDPIVHWAEGGAIRSNAPCAAAVLEACAAAGVRQVRVSFATLYRKMWRRGVQWFDPPLEEKLALAKEIVRQASHLGINVANCAQPFLALAGAHSSGCIDGALLQELHPLRLQAPTRRDRGQRPHCLCTQSVDIGSYAQKCPGGCLYCYANPAWKGPPSAAQAG
jgi:DNA repair photolyase